MVEAGERLVDFIILRWQLVFSERKTYKHSKHFRKSVFLIFVSIAGHTSLLVLKIVVQVGLLIVFYALNV